MLTPSEVHQTVEEQIRSLLQEEGEELDDPLTAETEVQQLDLDSLTLARLLLQLDETFGVENPFEENENLADVRSIGDIVGIYVRALAKTEGDETRKEGLAS